METRHLLEIVNMLGEAPSVLFFDGGWGRQPVWLIEAYQIYRAELAQYNKLK